MRSDTMGFFDDSARIDDIGTAEQHLRNGNKKSGFVDGGEKFIQIKADRVRAGYKLHAGAEPALLVIEVLNGGKFQVGHHHFVARAAEIEARADDRLDERHVLMQRNFAGSSADERCDLVANADGHVPPALFPGAHAALGPGVRVSAHFVVYGARHGPEGIADHIRRAVENRELAPPLQKAIHCVRLHRET